jgi:hypothetical protein
MEPFHWLEPYGYSSSTIFQIIMSKIRDTQNELFEDNIVVKELEVA